MRWGMARRVEGRRMNFFTETAYLSSLPTYTYISFCSFSLFLSCIPYSFSLVPVSNEVDISLMRLLEIGMISLK
jgi:hypothetical protein